MFVISVSPLKRGITIDTLSYFSSTAYPIGTILTIPVRNAPIFGLVTKSEAVSTAKTALRAATFSLKKLPPQIDAPIIGNAYIKTAQALSAYYATPLGTILYNLLPPEIRSGDIPLPHTHHLRETATHTPQILHASKKDRYLSYRSLVRETFAHSGSILMVVPSSIDASEIEIELGAGIADRIITLTSTMTTSELKKAYRKLDDFSKTKLIIATTSHAIIERHDITLVIMEHARSTYYKEFNRPYLDYRDVLRIHAQHAGRKIIFADILPRTEEEKLRRDENYYTYGETPKRMELSGKLEIINMVKDITDTTNFSLISPEVMTQIKNTRKKKENVFLFAARRGLAPLVSCMDCTHIFRSPESGAPYSLIRTVRDGVEERWFVCSVSGEKIRAAETCPACGSWRLRERGIGIQQVYDELHKLFPDVPIILFDHLSARTYKKALFLRDTFYTTRGAILLGTHMAIPYLTKPVSLSVVVNMDALLATPTWRIEEENLALLLTLRERTRDTVLVQTRTPESGVLTHAKAGSVEQFYTEELELRKAFNYPPYATFIHFTWQGTLEHVKKIEEEISRSFASFGITIYPNPTAPSTAPIFYALIRVPSTDWPHPEIIARIKNIHPSVRVVINPDRIV